jgi:hypothetical protein
MKITRTLLLTGTALALLLIGDAPHHSGAPFGLQLAPEAHAIFGVWRRHARRWAVVGTAAVVGGAAVAGANDANAYNEGYNDATTTEHQQQAAAAPAPAPATGGKPLPLGTVTDSLPPDCTSTPVGGKQYYYCGGNFYRAVLQGNNLVYVTAKP